MPAPQQSQTPVYKETSNIPRPRTADFLFDVRDNPAHNLARALGVVVDKAGDQYKDNKAKLQAEEDAINAAHAQLGLEKFNARQATGTLDLVLGDYDPDAYAAKQGQLAGIELAGSLRDKYLADGMDQVDDPQAFSQWLNQNIAGAAEAAKAKGLSYYSSFIREVGNGGQTMSMTWANHAQQVVGRRSKDASRKRLALSRQLDQVSTNEKELQGWMQRFFVSESGGNFNAVFGDAGSNEDLSGLTLRELYQRQTTDGKNSAAGLIQLTPGTLKSLIDEGFDPNARYTPEMQMTIGLHLMKRRGLTEWLKGDIRDDQFIDRLALEWAGFKNSRGTGAYDNDGVNRATQSAADTRRMLHELRFLLDENPHLKTFALNKTDAATVDKVIDPTAPTPTSFNSNKVLTDEVGIGVPNKDQRDQYTDLIIEDLEAGNVTPDRLEAQMKAAKLNTEQRERVRRAADTVRATNEYKAKQERLARIQNVDKAIREHDEEALGSLKASDPDIYDRLMQVKAGNVENPDIETSTSEFRENAPYGSDSFPERAMGALLDGDINVQTYNAAMHQHEAQVAANRVIRMPGIHKPMAAIEAAVPAGMKDTYRALVALSIANILKQAPEGTFPATEIISGAQEVAAQVTAMLQKEQEALMGKPEYQLGDQ